jgi:AbrB family looped-hinge helix DNA binding protein
MTTRVGSKGQIVIPKEIRDRVSLHSGDEVDVELQGTTIVVTARKRPRGLGGRFAQSGMAARLLEDRAVEPQ